MDIAVTGGRGTTGRWIVDRLAADHDVVCLDRELPDDGHPDVAYRALDLVDAGGVFDLFTRIDPDAVVHWAAVPVAGTRPGVDLYRNNTLAAHAVLTAAGRVGARIVQASSDGAYGFFFAEETPLPDAVPVVEDHPLRPEDPYGLSKVVAEEIAATVARRDDVSVASLRPTWIQQPGEYPCRDEAYLGDRSAGAGNFWSYVDVRDVVDIVECALDAPIDGHEAFNCSAADNALGEPLVDLLEAEYGAVPDECRVEGDAAAYSTAKAERMFGWTPSRSWRAAADESVRPPEV